jgi:hypothetical protein
MNYEIVDMVNDVNLFEKKPENFSAIVSQFDSIFGVIIWTKITTKNF